MKLYLQVTFLISKLVKILNNVEKNNIKIKSKRVRD